MADVIKPSFGGGAGGGGPTITELKQAIQERDQLIAQMQSKLNESHNKLATAIAVSEMLQLQLLDLIKNEESAVRASQIAIKNLQEILKRLPKI